ncbi:MAG TPA: hypothetical protein VKR30_09220 [Candidatus Limnocylindrales bacterium]|nr:hypothetical protein [Candidatus Limnocylindrales bacterium]
MNVALTAVAVAVGVGAIIAVSSRDPRAALIGLAIVLVGATFLIDPLPSAASVGVRIVGGLLCLSIVRLAADVGQAEGASSPLGWPAEGLIAIAAAVGGAAIALQLAVVANGADLPASHSDVLAAAGSPAIVILAAAAAVLAVGLTPAALGRPGFGRAVGVALVTVGVTLLRVGFAGSQSAPNDLEQIAIAGLLVGGAACGVGLAHASGARLEATADAEDVT